MLGKQIYFAILACILAANTGAQTWELRGKVIDHDDNSPLPFVNISVVGSTLGTATDLDGNFHLRLSGDAVDLRFSYIGYESKVLPFVNGSGSVVIKLNEKVDKLDEVTVFPGINPAHRIIKKAVDNRSKNNPNNLPTFSYDTYSKFVVTINTDSLDPSIDTVYRTTENDSVMEFDSTNYEMANFFSRQHLLFMETLTQRNYIKGKRDNEVVLASRTSGFKNPLFALISTEMQSFSFYEDYISIAGTELLNPITPGSTSRYFFLLRDTLYNSPEDTVYAISFRPKPRYGFEPMKGVLYINTSNWAIQNVIARPVETESVQIEIEQKYKRFDERTWFPHQLNAQVIFDNISVESVRPEASIRTNIRNVQIGEELKAKSISRALITIDDDASSQSEALLAKYRTDSLDDREKYTYAFMDSLSEAENLEKKLALLVTLGQGRVPLGPVDLLLDRMFIVNRYEGFRPGLELRTNRRFSEILQLGAYSGYGFRDYKWKYELYGRIMLHKNSNLSLIGGHRFDVIESARPDLVQAPYRGLWQNNFRQFFVSQVDEIKRNYAGVTWDPLGTLGFKAVLQQEQRRFIGDYTFAPADPDINPGNQYRFTEAIFSMRYAPEEEFIETPSYGRLKLAQKFPVVFAQYTRGIAGLLEGDIEYNKWDVLLHHRRQTLFLGELDLSVMAGLILEDLPYSKLYTGLANQLTSDNFWTRMTPIADRYSFETMRFNEFLFDQYVQVMFRQNLKTLLFRRDWFAPRIELVARALWGDLKSPESHQEVDFRIPKFGYYEGGVEINNIITSGFSGFGAGFFYRVGPYSLPSFEENFAIKLSFTFAF